MNEPKQILESRGERLTNIWIGIGVVNAVFFLFISGRIYDMVKGFLTIFGE